MSEHGTDAAARLTASRARLQRFAADAPAGESRTWPLALVAGLANEAGRQALQPMAQRHPYALVGAAMAGGALLVCARPWLTRVPSPLWSELLQLLAGPLADAASSYKPGRRAPMPTDRPPA